jgi:hypothetical protein
VNPQLNFETNDGMKTIFSGSDGDSGEQVLIYGQPSVPVSVFFGFLADLSKKLE